MTTDTKGPKYPKIKVRLTGQDGNAFAILARVQKAMRREAIERAEIDAFLAEATSGDYDALLRTCTRWVTVS